jgi:hypothetical protein
MSLSKNLLMPIHRWLIGSNRALKGRNKERARHRLDCSSDSCFHTFVAHAVEHLMIVFTRIFLCISTILSIASYARSQEQESPILSPAHSSPKRFCGHHEQYLRSQFLKVTEQQLPCLSDTKAKNSAIEFFEAGAPHKQSESQESESLSPDEPNTAPGKRPMKFHWKPFLVQSTLFLGFQHGYRLLMQKPTREGLRGPFFHDWLRTEKNLRGWNDDNSFFVNYIAHPLQGGITGHIFVNNSDLASKQTFGKSKQYWKSRFKAFVWSTAWSTQYELGLVSEANIGNVGLKPKPTGHSGMAYVDLVVTPVIGTGLLVAEDAIDKYILRDHIEKHGYRKRTIKILRSVLTPTTTVGNLLRFKAPWKRNNRR